MTQEVYRRTGRLIDLPGLPVLTPGGVYRVIECSPGLLTLEEMDVEELLDTLTPMQWGAIAIDPDARVIRYGSTNVKFTRHEWQLVSELMRHAGLSKDKTGEALAGIAERLAQGLKRAGKKPASEDGDGGGE